MFAIPGGTYIRQTSLDENYLLKLNDDKTELIVLGTRPQLSKIGEVSIKIGNDTISTVPSVQNLGIHFDKELKWIIIIINFI